jgi:hypothetical protein
MKPARRNARVQTTGEKTMSEGRDNTVVSTIRELTPEEMSAVAGGGLLGDAEGLLNNVLGATEGGLNNILGAAEGGLNNVVGDVSSILGLKII